MAKARIYTRGGDQGNTSLAGGKRVPKDHPRVKAYGTIDELNAFLGLLAAAVESAKTKDLIIEIEQALMNIGGYLATESPTTPPLTATDISLLEKNIDEIEAVLPAIHGFILPADSEAAARANVCRTVCRRAERQIVALQQETNIDNRVITYMNRLSDYLFLLQRQLLDGKEKIWQNACK